MPLHATLQRRVQAGYESSQHEHGHLAWRHRVKKRQSAWLDLRAQSSGQWARRKSGTYSHQVLKVHQGPTRLTPGLACSVTTDDALDNNSLDLFGCMTA